MHVYFKCSRETVFPAGNQTGELDVDWLGSRLLWDDAVKSVLVSPETYVQSGRLTTLTENECLVCFVPFVLESPQSLRKFGMQQSGDFPLRENDSRTFVGLRDDMEYQADTYVFFYNRSCEDTIEQVITDFVNAIKSGEFDVEPQKYAHCAALTIVDGASARPVRPKLSLHQPQSKSLKN